MFMKLYIHVKLKYNFIYTYKDRYFKYCDNRTTLLGGRCFVLRMDQVSNTLVRCYNERMDLLLLFLNLCSLFSVRVRSPIFEKR